MHFSHIGTDANLDTDIGTGRQTQTSTHISKQDKQDLRLESQ